MKFRISFLTAGLLFALAGVAQAQTSCGTNDFELISDSAVAQGLMNIPAKYAGFITSGNLSPGLWALNIDDTGWPTSANARRSHIISMYTYNSGNETFTLTLPMESVDIMLDGPDQTFQGVASVTFVIQDNGNGTISNSEFNNAQAVTMNVDASCAGTGTALCGGVGSGAGSANPTIITTPLTGTLATSTCATAVVENPWGGVKKLFRE